MPAVVRAGSHLRRLVAAAAVVSVTCGVPAVLVSVGGNPLSARFTGAIVRLPELVIRGTPVHPPDLVAWIVAVCIGAAWVVWAWMCTCLVVEARAQRLGLPAPRLPAARTFQSVAALLVGGVLTISAFGRPGQLDIGARTAASGAAGSPSHGSAVLHLAGRRRVLPAWSTGASRPDEDDGPSAPGDRVGRVTTHGFPVIDDFAEWLAGGGAPARGDTTERGADLGGSTGATGGPVERLGEHAGHRAGHAQASERLDALQQVCGPVHLVGRRETLWSIAERTLGSSLRWPEIASLNYGVVQPDGGSLASDHWVRPGWRLQLPVPAGTPTSRPLQATPGEPADTTPADTTPADTTPADTTPADTTPADGARGGNRAEAVSLFELGTAIALGAGATVLVDRLRRAQSRRRPIDRFPRLADGTAVDLERRLRSEARSHDVREAVRAVRHAVAAVEPSERDGSSGNRVVAVHVTADDVAVLVDSVGSQGDGGAAVPVPFRPHPVPGWSVVSRHALGRSTPFHDRGDADADSDLPQPLPLALVTVAVGAGSAALVDLFAVGPTIVGGPPDVVDAQLRSFVVELATAPWRWSTRVVAVGLGAVPSGLPGVEVAADASPVLDELEASPCPSSRCEPGRGTARTSREGPTGRAHAEALLVVCGSRCRGSDVERLVRLARTVGGGTTVVAAEPRPDRAGPVPVLEELVCSGDGHGARRARVGDPASFVSPYCFPSPPAVDGSDVLETDPLSHPTPDTSAARAAGSRPAGLDPEDAEALGALVAATHGDAVSADAAPYRALTMPLPRRYGPTTESAPVGPGAAPVGPGAAPPVAGVPIEGPGPDRAPIAAEAAPDLPSATGARPGAPEVEVLVLGPVEVRGATRPFTRAWARELVVYLAMHERGATTDAWAEALWPDRTLAPSSLHSTASVARRALGVASDGLDHLPRSQGRLLLRPTVGTDWARFVRLADEEDPDAWSEALGLVRGRPFEGLRAPDWPLLEGISPAIEASVVDLAGRRSAVALKRGDARASSWAARQGLQVSPYDERLYRMLMRAADLAGNSAGVEAVMAELLTLVADDVEPCDSVHPATIDLYRQLSRRSRLPRVASGA